MIWYTTITWTIYTNQLILSISPSLLYYYCSLSSNSSKTKLTSSVSKSNTVVVVVCSHSLLSLILNWFSGISLFSLLYLYPFFALWWLHSSSESFHVEQLAFYLSLLSDLLQKLLRTERERSWELNWEFIWIIIVNIHSFILTTNLLLFNESRGQNRLLCS